MYVGDSLLLSDKEDDEKSFQEKNRISNKARNSILNPVYSPIDIDIVKGDEKEEEKEKEKKGKENENGNGNGNGKIIMTSKILLNPEQSKKPENAPTTQNNALFNFIFDNNPQTIKEPIIEQPAKSKPNIQSPPSSFSNSLIDKNSKIKAQNKISIQNSSLLKPTPKIIEEIFDEKKEFEEKIKEYKTQKENIRKGLPIEIEKKRKEYEKEEKNNKEEIDILEKRYAKELKDQENYFNEKKKKYNEKISDIEKEKMSKLRELKNSEETIFNQQIEQLENKFQIDKENIESNHKLELEKINMELEKLKENKTQIINDKISSRKIDDIYEEIYTKINSTNNDTELNFQLKNKELLKKDLESKCKELSQQANLIKENVNIFDKKISEKKMELEEIIEKIEKEKNELRNREYELKNKELEMINYLDRNQIALDEEEKNLEIKFEEQSNLYNINEELIKDENVLKEEKESFEKDKKAKIEALENKKKEIQNQFDEIKKLELQVEINLNDLKINENEIIKSFNEIENSKEDNLLEKQYIEKEKFNIEIAEKRIQNDIKILNEDKAYIEKEKQRIMKMKMDIEQQNKLLDNEYKIIEQHNKILDLKSRTIDNMRMNNILNNAYQNNNDFDEIGLKTMPNFGNYGVSGLNFLKNENKNNNFNNTGDNFNNTADNFIKPNKNFAQTFSVFNQGGRKINADEYFEKITKEIQDKRRLEKDNEYDINNYIINGNNFIKDTRKQLKELDNK